MSEHVCKTADDFCLVGTFNPQTGLYRIHIQYDTERCETIEMDRDQLDCLQDHIAGLLEPFED